MLRQSFISALAASGLLLTGACERDRSAAGPRSARAHAGQETPAPRFDALSPSETLRTIRRFRAGGALHRIKPYLLPGQREAVIDHLLAVDELVTAHQTLSKVIAERIGVGSATAFDPQAVANIVGVFSADVEIVDETVSGDRATVTISVAGRLPLEPVHMVMRESRWMLETDPPIPGLTGEIRKLANIADRVVLELKSRRMTAEQVRRELNLRQAPVLAGIKELTERHADPAP